MPALLFNDGKWDILTNAWSAASKGGNSTELCYSWAIGTTGFGDSATGVERITLKVPFNVFASYAAECERKSEIIDLSTANLPKVLSTYGRNQKF